MIVPLMPFRRRLAAVSVASLCMNLPDAASACNYLVMRRHFKTNYDADAVLAIDPPYGGIYVGEDEEGGDGGKVDGWLTTSQMQTKIIESSSQILKPIREQRLLLLLLLPTARRSPP